MLSLSSDLKNRLEIAESMIASQGISEHRLDDAEVEIAALQSQVKDLSARMKDTESDVSDNVDDISSLDVRVQEGEGDIAVLDMMASVNMMSLTMVQG